MQVYFFILIIVLQWIANDIEKLFLKTTQEVFTRDVDYVVKTGRSISNNQQVLLYGLSVLRKRYERFLYGKRFIQFVSILAVGFRLFRAYQLVYVFSPNFPEPGQYMIVDDIRSWGQSICLLIMLWYSWISIPRYIRCDCTGLIFIEGSIDERRDLESSIYQDVLGSAFDNAESIGRTISNINAHLVNPKMLNE